jgi:hypothetical protein
MSVPEEANVTAKRAIGPDRPEADVVGSWNGTDRPRAAVGRPGWQRNGPVTISPRSCVRAARAQGYALRQGASMTRPRGRQAKRVGAPWDQIERRWCASAPGVEALERWLPFVDLVRSSCCFIGASPCLGIRLRRHVGRLGTTMVAPDMLQATAVADQVATVQRGTLSPDLPGLRGLSAVVADAVARVAVARPGRLRKPADLTQAVHAPSGCSSPPAWAEPRARREGETPDA